MKRGIGEGQVYALYDFVFVRDGLCMCKKRRGEDLRFNKKKNIQSGECVFNKSHGIYVGISQSQSGVSSDTFMPGKQSASGRGS